MCIHTHIPIPNIIWLAFLCGIGIYYVFFNGIRVNQNQNPRPPYGPDRKVGPG